MMVTALGIARLTAGQNNAVLPVYTGTNAPPSSTSALAALRRPAGAGLFFLAGDRPLRRRAALHALRPLRLRDRRQRGGGAAVGHRVGRVKIATYAISGMLAGIAAVLYRRAVPAGQARRGRRARARRHRRRRHRRHQPDGRARRHRRHARRRADLRAALQHPAAPQHQLEPAARAEGPDHRRHRARSRSATSARSLAACAQPVSAAARRPEPAAERGRHGEKQSRSIGGNTNETS